MYNFFNPAPPTGQWMNVDNYEQVQQMSVPINGSPTLFMLKDSPVFYVVTMVNGQKLINGYSFTALHAPESQIRGSKEDVDIITLTERINSLESTLGEIHAMLKEGKSNESSRTTASKSKSSQCAN